jgi:uncharacterized protein YggT (Ycf19 family)
MYRDSETGLVFHHGVIARHPFAVRAAQVVNFIFGVLYVLLLTRLVLAYVEARTVPFVQWLNQVTSPFFHPFNGIIAEGHDPGGHPIAWSIVAAIIAYGLVNALIVSILRAVNRPPVEEA